MKCIYCLQDKHVCDFSKTEHVLPKSFGAFKNNFVLKGIVCDECNQYFGDNLEINLARDTYEGSILRYKYKIKPNSKFKSVGSKSRIETIVQDGLFKGARAYKKYDKETDKILLEPLPQIGFQKSGSAEYDYFLLDEIPEAKFFDNKKYAINNPRGFAILGCDQEAAVNALKVKGYSSFGKENKSWVKVGPCRKYGKIDQIILRTIAKIGFNYLAYCEGPTVLHQDFNSVRRYIRTGDVKDYTLPIIDKEPISPDEELYGHKRQGHTILITRMPNSQSIYAFISLFNWARYSVCLTENFSSQKDILNAHLFHINSNKIIKLPLRKST